MLLKKRAVSAGPSKSSLARDNAGVSSSKAYNSRIWFRRFNVPRRASFYDSPRESERTNTPSDSSSDSRGTASDASDAFDAFADPRGFVDRDGFDGFDGFTGFDDFADLEDLGFAGFAGFDVFDVFDGLADSRGCAGSSETAVFATSRANRRCRAGFSAGIGETGETGVFRGLPRRPFAAGIGWEGLASPAGTDGTSAGVAGTDEIAGMDGTDGTAGIELTAGIGATEGTKGIKFPAVPGSTMIRGLRVSPVSLVPLISPVSTIWMGVRGICAGNFASKTAGAG